jgi:quinol monooxygenase YgiN
MANSLTHKEAMLMPTIEAKTGVVTHINVFTVPKEKQQELVDSLIETVKAAREVPGWISASVHRSFDGTHVTNYVQFESPEAAQAVLQHLAAGGYLQRNTAMGAVAPGQYEVVYTIERD